MKYATGTKRCMTGFLSVTVKRRAAWSCPSIPPSRTGDAADACCCSNSLACDGNEGWCAMYWDIVKPAESTENYLVGCTCRVGGVRGGRPRSSAAFMPRQDRDRFCTLRLSVRFRNWSLQDPHPPREHRNVGGPEHHVSCFRLSECMKMKNWAACLHEVCMNARIAGGFPQFRQIRSHLSCC